VIILDSTVRSLEFKLGGAPSTNQLRSVISYTEQTPSTHIGATEVAISNSGTAVTILAAPASSTQRVVKSVTIRNRDTAPVALTVQYNDNATLAELVVIDLAVDDILFFTDLELWTVLKRSGEKKSIASVTGAVTVTGTVTSNAGTNLNTSALALEATQTTQNTQIGIVTETAPASDTASSGLNGRLQRIAQRITSLIALLPTALVSGRLDVNLGAAPATVTLAALPTGTNIIGNVGHGKTLKIASGTLTADTDIVAAVSTKRIKVVGYSLTSSGINANTVIFKSNGAAGTELWRVLLQSSANISSGANLVTQVPGFLFATVAGEKLTMDVNQTDAIHYSISYFDDDTT